MVPAAGAAHLHHVDGERLLAVCQAVEFFGGSGRPGHLAELLAEHPRNESDLLFSADRADHIAALAVEFRGPQQVGAGIAHFRDAASTGVDLGEQRPPLQRVIHHLPLCSHAFQSTCGSRRSGWGVCCATVPPFDPDELLCTGAVAGTGSVEYRLTPAGFAQFVDDYRAGVRGHRCRRGQCEHRTRVRRAAERARHDGDVSVRRRVPGIR